MFIYLPAFKKLLSISAITEIKTVKVEDGYCVKIFYWKSASSLGEHAIFCDKEESRCQSYIQELSERLPSITLMRGFTTE